jgi:hypothetical protein
MQIHFCTTFKILKFSFVQQHIIYILSIRFYIIMLFLTGKERYWETTIPTSWLHCCNWNWKNKTGLNILVLYTYARDVALSLVKFVKIRAVCYFHIILSFKIVSGSSNAFQAYIEKEDSKKLKQKQRERVQPKMGKMDIDYQVRLFRPIKTRRNPMPYVFMFPHNGQDTCRLWFIFVECLWDIK